MKNLFERVAVVLFERAITRAKEAMSRAEGTGPRASKVRFLINTNVYGSGKVRMFPYKH